MRTLSILSLVGVIVFLGLMVLNLHDYWYRPDLPWREGDFRAVILKNGLGAFVCGLTSLLFFIMSKLVR